MRGQHAIHPLIAFTRGDVFERGAQTVAELGRAIYAAAAGA